MLFTFQGLQNPQSANNQQNNTYSIRKDLIHVPFAFPAKSSHESCHATTFMLLVNSSIQPNPGDQGNRHRHQFSV